MTRLKINTWTGILDIVNCVLFAASWFVVFGDALANGSHAADSSGTFFYVMAWFGVILNVIALLQSRRHGISLVGPVLGIIGSALFGFTAAMAFPALVVLIVATVFTMLQHPSKSYVQSHNSNLNNQ
ncbi:transporter [Lentilactobacillus hilgardii]|uniref:Transporter n=1 Tax=Lentilactobacillus hilgardii TaxID=1588 RepID=A0A6P1E7K9_LENHI|nr:transporter [Lentilactobacillus hilgardii]QHB51221.1 transporter [Lentilactobacillus hilgardii]